MIKGYLFIREFGLISYFNVRCSSLRQAELPLLENLHLLTVKLETIYINTLGRRAWQELHRPIELNNNKPITFLAQCIQKLLCRMDIYHIQSNILLHHLGSIACRSNIRMNLETNTPMHKL